jgi:hypothetical protein
VKSFAHINLDPKGNDRSVCPGSTQFPSQDFQRLVSVGAFKEECDLHPSGARVFSRDYEATIRLLLDYASAGISLLLITGIRYILIRIRMRVKINVYAGKRVDEELVRVTNVIIDRRHTGRRSLGNVVVERTCQVHRDFSRQAGV